MDQSPRVVVTPSPPRGGSGVPKSLLRTFSQDEEEVRTAGSGTDLLAEEAFYPTGSPPEEGGVVSEGGVDFQLEQEVESGSHDLSEDHKEENPVFHEQPEADGGVADQNSKEGVAGEEEGGVVAEKDVGAAGEGEKGVSEEKQLSEMERLAEVNPTYAKYIMEKKKASEELRLRSTSDFLPRTSFPCP